MNRIKPIAVLADKKERLEAYRKLYDTTHGQHKIDFSREEIESLLLSLEKETDKFCREQIWRNLLSVHSHDEIKTKALALLKNTQDYERYYAIAYLLWNYPDMFDEFWKKYHDDKDPNVRYRLAEILLEKDEDKALTMMLEILPDARKIIGNHEVCDAIEIIILESKNEKYIELLTKLKNTEN